MKKLSCYVVFVALISLSASNAFGWTQPDMPCAELTKFSVKAVGDGLFLRAKIKPDKGCSLMELRIPAFKGLRVQNARGLNKGGVYVEPDAAHKLLKVRFRIKRPVTIYSVWVVLPNMADRVDLLAAATHLKALVARYNTAKTGIRINGPGGWMGQLDLFPYSPEWKRWAKQECRKTLRGRYGWPKTKDLWHSRKWCKRSFPALR